MKSSSAQTTPGAAASWRVGASLSSEMTDEGEIEGKRIVVGKMVLVGDMGDM